MPDNLTIDDLLGSADVAEKIASLKFENGLKLLEELVTKVESGALALDVAVLSYERGALLVAHLRNLLAGAEDRLKVLQKPHG